MIKFGLEYKQNPKKEYFDQIMDLLDDVFNIFTIGLLIRKIIYIIIGNHNLDYYYLFKHYLEKIIELIKNYLKVKKNFKFKK